MTRKPLLVALAAAMVLLAGCTGSLSGSPSAGDGTVAGDTGTVNFYISDQPAAIEDFEHLNVTITKVGFQQAADDDEQDDRNETDDDAAPNGTVTPETDRDGEDAEMSTPAPSTMTTTPVNDTGTEAPEAQGDDDEGEDADDGDESDDADDSDESGGWVEYEVDNRTVDLTELRGANASLIEAFDVPAGNYTKVFVHVGEVDATLENGESVNVKLPSEKLHINERFEVANGSEVDFVFDIAVHKAGNSGKYILRPVISESGTDVPIERVDDDDEREDDERDDDEAALEAAFVGDVAPGEDATVEVTSEGNAVENATVYVNDEQVGTTDADGRMTFEVPDGEELEVTIRSGEAEAELEREFEDEPSDERKSADGTPTATGTA